MIISGFRECFFNNCREKSKQDFIRFGSGTLPFGEKVGTAKEGQYSQQPYWPITPEEGALQAQLEPMFYCSS